jgi:curli biogenesis system outer membrane secretion channel CsgG
MAVRTVDKKRCVIWLLTAIWLVAGIPACSGTGMQHPAGPVSVAVWDFEDLSPGMSGREGMGELLAAQVAARMAEAGNYQLVERKDLLKVMEELHLGSTQLADADTRLRLGRIVGAQQMIFGAFQVIGRTMRLDIRCVDVASGRIIKTAKSLADAGNEGAWLDAANRAAADLITP